MKTKLQLESEDVGVIVGRFQTDNLHAGHHELIQHVCKAHHKVIIFLGCSPIQNTKRNPLNYETRMQMISSEYPNLIILPITDMETDDIWSKSLDSKIREITRNETVKLYGSRESFIEHYTGKFKTEELIPNLLISASEIREQLKNKVLSSSDFRAGQIYYAMHQYSEVHPTVDCAIYDEKNNRVLLGKKATESKYRFIGGHIDSNETGVEACIREVKEETNIDIQDHSICHISTVPIDDWRYKNEDESIITSFYVGYYYYKTPHASDDIDELKWFDVSELKNEIIVNEHHILLKLLLSYFEDRCF